MEQVVFLNSQVGHHYSTNEIENSGIKGGKTSFGKCFPPTKSQKKMNMLELEDKYNISLYKWY